MSEAYEKLERWSNATAQQLQEILDDAEECGSELTGIQELLDEYDSIMNELNGSWQELLANTDDGDESDSIDFGETR